MDPKTLAGELGRELRELGTSERAEKEKAYLKSSLTHLGVTVPLIQKVAKTFKKTHRDLDHDALIALVEELWSEPIHEHRFLAMELLEAYPKLLGEGDLELIERLLRESKTWALVDSLATEVVGRLVERFPSLTSTLDRWARDGDFWIRRAAMLALLRPLRRGEGDFPRFARYADSMLEERELFIRKAIGWILRETSKKRPDLVYLWLAPRATRASGLTLREASKYLPADQRESLLAARKG